MKQVREANTWEYTGEQPDRDEPIPLEEDDVEILNFFFWKNETVENVTNTLI